MSKISCIYCCKSDADTRDHVPPKLLLRKPYPSNLWTVPACGLCNEAFSLDEEYFRNMVIGIFCHTAEADELFDGSISRSFERRAHLEDVFWNSLDVDDGRPFVEIEQGRFDRIANKIIRGLHYLESGSMLPLNAHVSPSFSEIQTSDTLDAVNGAVYNDTFAPDFSFRHNSYCWQLVFYETFQCIATIEYSIQKGM